MEFGNDYSEACGINDGTENVYADNIPLTKDANGEPLMIHCIGKIAADKLLNSWIKYVDSYASTYTIDMEYVKALKVSSIWPPTELLMVILPLGHL